MSAFSYINLPKEKCVYKPYFYSDRKPLRTLKDSDCLTWTQDNVYKISAVFVLMLFAVARFSTLLLWHLPFLNELSLMIRSSSSANTPDIWMNAFVIGSISPFEQSTVILPTITSLSFFSFTVSIISQSCFVLVYRKGRGRKQCKNKIRCFGSVHAGRYSVCHWNC